MKIIAITGSIAVGKSVISNLINNLGYLVFDADRCVKRQYLININMIDAIKNKFPCVIINNRIEKKLLKEKIFNDNNSKSELENIIHPIIKNKLKQFLAKSALNGENMVFVDIPLLYEIGWDKYCDYVINIQTDENIQKKRVINRDKISEELFEKIKKSQIDMQIKSQLADFVIINNNKDVKKLKIDVINIIENII